MATCDSPGKARPTPQDVATLPSCVRYFCRRARTVPSAPPFDEASLQAYRSCTIPHGVRHWDDLDDALEAEWALLFPPLSLRRHMMHWHRQQRKGVVVRPATRGGQEEAERLGAEMAKEMERARKLYDISVVKDGEDKGDIMYSLKKEFQKKSDDLEKEIDEIDASLADVGAVGKDHGKVSQETLVKQLSEKLTELAQLSAPDLAILLVANESFADDNKGKKKTPKTEKEVQQDFKKMQFSRDGDLQKSEFENGLEMEMEEALTDASGERLKNLEEWLNEVKALPKDISALIDAVHSKDARKVAEILQTLKTEFELDDSDTLYTGLADAHTDSKTCTRDPSSSRDPSGELLSGKAVFAAMKPLFRDIFCNILFGPEKCTNRDTWKYTNVAGLDLVPPPGAQTYTGGGAAPSFRINPMVRPPGPLPEDEAAQKYILSGNPNIRKPQDVRHTGVQAVKKNKEGNDPPLRPSHVRMEIVSVSAPPDDIPPDQRRTWAALAPGDLVVHIFGQQSQDFNVNPALVVVPRQGTKLGKWVPFRYKVLHQYWRHYRRLCKGCIAEFDEELPARILRLANLGNPTGKIVLVAHSMGTAFAHILTYQLLGLQGMDKRRLHIILMGSSAHSNVTFANYMMRKLPRNQVIHCLMEGDPTPWVPPIPGAFVCPTAHVAYFKKVATNEYSLRKNKHKAVHWHYWQRFQIECGMDG